MRKIFVGIVLLALTIAVPMPTKAEVFVNINIGPPVIEFAAPPELIVLPGTYVYVVPDVDTDIFFYGGWWWRPWEGRWYRSRHYGSGWVTYRSVPSFYRGIHSGWRDDYRAQRWQGHRWDYKRIPHRELNRNWKGWEKNKYWEQKQRWGVEGYRVQPRKQVAPRAVQKERSRQQREPDRGAVEQQERKSRAQQAPKEQSRSSRPQLKEDRPEQSQQPQSVERRQSVKPGQGSDSQQPDQKVESRQSRPQAQEVKSDKSDKSGKPEKSRKKPGKSENEEEEQQGRR
jgi:hypothetical protein